MPDIFIAYCAWANVIMIPPSLQNNHQFNKVVGQYQPKLFVYYGDKINEETFTAAAQHAFFNNEDKEELRKEQTAKTEPNIWRIIMKSRITKLAAAAVIIIAVLIGINHFGGSVDIATPAYALEQTIQASHSVQYLHIRAITPSHEDQPVEFWLEFTQDGQPKNM